MSGISALIKEARDLVCSLSATCEYKEKSAVYNPEESSHQNLTMLALFSGTSSLWNSEK